MHTKNTILPPEMQGGKPQLLIQQLEPKKARSLLLAASLERIGLTAQALAVRECGTYVEVATLREGGQKIVAANFCKHRLCPACSWRRGLRIYSATSAILDAVDQQQQAATGKPAKLLFLTLTVAAVKGEALGPTIDAMSAGYNRLRNNRRWKQRILGCMRTLEITINPETGMYHPHYHLILHVPATYAKKGSGLYLTTEEWVALWRTSMGLSYDPVCWIERVKGSRRQQVAELAKYLAKDSDYLLDEPEETDARVAILAEHLKGRRLVAYSGTLRKAQQQLRLSEPEEAPLVDDLRGDVAICIRRYHWHAGLGSYVPGRITEAERPQV